MRQLLVVLLLALSMTAACKKQAEQMEASRQRLVASATPCPAPATCTGKVTLPSREVSVCAPSPDAETYASGDIVLVKEMGIDTLAKIRKRSGKVYVVELPDGFEQERPADSFVGRVCK